MASVSVSDFDFSFFKDESWSKMLQQTKQISEMIARIQAQSPAYDSFRDAIKTYYQWPHALSHTTRFADAYKAIIETQQFYQESMQSLSAIAKEVAATRSEWEASIKGLNDLVQSYQAITRPLQKKAVISDTVQTIHEVESITFPEETDMSEQASVLSETEKSELASEINDAISQHENWEQRLMALLLSYRDQHPIFAWIIKNVFLVILLGIAASMIYERFIGSVDKPAAVRAEPRVSATSIYIINQHQDIIILDDVPYYYYVEFDDPESQQAIQGYISKRSVKNVRKEELPNEGETESERD